MIAGQITKGDPMKDPLSLLRAMRRPRLLVRAARFGMCDYQRDRDLTRLLKSNRLPSPAHALTVLAEQEEVMEHTRQTGEATYSIARHIELLVAMIAEARLIPTPPQRPVG